MKVQRFYKRGDKSVHYDIPYAGDEYTPYVEGTATVASSGGYYTLATTVAGQPSEPQGMLVTKFLKQFEKEENVNAMGYHVFELEGANGDTIQVDNVTYNTPLIVIRKTGMVDYIMHFEYGYGVTFNLFRNGGIGISFVGKKVDTGFRSPYNFPTSQLPSKTIFNIEYGTTLLTRQSIIKTVTMIANNNGTVTDEAFYNRTNYYNYKCSVSSDDGTVSGNANVIGRISVGSSDFSSYHELSVDRLQKILAHVKYDNVDVEEEDEDDEDEDDDDGGTVSGQIPEGEDIEPPDKPGKNGANTGLLRGYVLSQAQVTNFSSWLWTDDVIDYISKLFTSNPLDSIITFSMLPYTPHTGTGTSIVLGGKACTEVADALLIDEQFSTFEFTYNGLTDPIWGNALDYEKGVKIELYVPFVGIVPLDVNSVIFTKISLKYIIDCFSGQGIVYLVSQKTDSTWDGARKKCLLGQWTFNCKSTLPLTRNDISSIISGAIGGITSIATGNIGGAISATMSARPSVQRSGDVATSTAYMSKRTPYIIYTMTKAIIPKGSYGKIGRPQYAVKTLGDCSGFVQCKNPRLSFTGGDGQSPTDEEIKEIYSLLEEGVVI